MKKLLIVIILSLFSLTAFSEEDKSSNPQINRGTVKKSCLELNRDIYDTKLHEIRMRKEKEFLNEKDKQVKKEVLKSLQKKLDCAHILEQ